MQATQDHRTSQEQRRNTQAFTHPVHHRPVQPVRKQLVLSRRDLLDQVLDTLSLLLRRRRLLDRCHSCRRCHGCLEWFVRVHVGACVVERHQFTLLVGGRSIVVLVEDVAHGQLLALGRGVAGTVGRTWNYYLLLLIITTYIYICLYYMNILSAHIFYFRINFSKVFYKIIVNVRSNMFSLICYWIVYLHILLCKASSYAQLWVVCIKKTGIIITITCYRCQLWTTNVNEHSNRQWLAYNFFCMPRRVHTKKLRDFSGTNRSKSHIKSDLTLIWWAIVR